MRIRVLGPPEVTGADGAARPLERKAREVLTLLALRAPAAVGLDELTGLLWDDPPPSATRTIQSHVSRLRAALAGGPASIGGAYALAAPAGTTDVDVLDRLRREARRLRDAGRHDEAAARLAEARALWRGDVELPATVAAGAVAQRWAQERRTLAEDHWAAVVDGSHPGDAVAELRAATTAGPLDEPSWALLVRALHRGGRAAEALRTFQDARAALAEVGLAPGGALRTAEAEALSGPVEPAPPPTPPAPPLGPSTPGPPGSGPSAPPTAGSPASGPPGPPTPGPHESGPAGRSDAPGPAAPGPEAFGRVRYARAGAVDVAYRTAGPAGGAPLVVLNPGAISIDALDGEPRVAAAFAALAARRRVVTFDRRGVGLSDPLTGPARLDDWVADTLAVLDATATATATADATADATAHATARTTPDDARPVLMAGSDVALVALRLAAEHPGRLRGLVLVHAYARYVRTDGYPYGVDPETARAASTEALAPEPQAGAFDPLAHIAPSVAGDDGFRRWWEGMGRRAASPATAAAIHEVVHAADVRDVVGRVTVPTLVLHRRSCASCDIGHARWLAAHLPAARLTVVAGADELWFTGDTGPLLAALDAFEAALPG